MASHFGTIMHHLRRLKVARYYLHCELLNFFDSIQYVNFSFIECLMQHVVQQGWTDNCWLTCFECVNNNFMKKEN